AAPVAACRNGCGLLDTAAHLERCGVGHLSPHHLYSSPTHYLGLRSWGPRLPWRHGFRLRIARIVPPRIAGTIDGTPFAGAVQGDAPPPVAVLARRRVVLPRDRM